MKTLALLMAFSLSAVGLANGETPNGKKDADKVKDSTAVEVEQKFEVQIEENHVTVTLHGEFDEFASVSLANHNGTDVNFQFIHDASNQIEFNTQDLEKGSYFVILSTKNEIRMKRFHKQ